MGKKLVTLIAKVLHQHRESLCLTYRPYFKKQKYGRIINTTSAAGIFGNFGQCNYSAAKLAQVGLTLTLAREGVKHVSNVIAPIAASRMTATVLPPTALELLKPEWVVPLVAVLTHSSSRENGSIFEVGGGNIAKLRRERSNGLAVNPEEGYSPSAILKGWSELNDFSRPEHPKGPIDFLAKRKTFKYQASGEGGPEIRFDDKVVLITGGGAG